MTIGDLLEGTDFYVIHQEGRKRFNKKLTVTQEPEQRENSEGRPYFVWFAQTNDGEEVRYFVYYDQVNNMEFFEEPQIESYLGGELVYEVY